MQRARGGAGMRSVEGIRVALAAFAALVALTGSLGFVTCGPEVEEDEATSENPAEAGQEEMMDDAIRDSDR
jgi:hypothetical protein